MKLKGIAYKGQSKVHYPHDEPETIYPSPFEEVVHIPKDLGWGEIRSIQIREGITLSFFDQRSTQPFTIRTQERHNLIDIDFLVSGQLRFHGLSDQQFCDASPGQSCLTLSKPSLDIEIPKDSSVYYANLHIQPSLLRNYLTDNDWIPKELSNQLTQRYPEPFNQLSHVTPSMQLVLRQIQHCPYQNSLRRLYLEGKIYELLAMRLEQLMTPDKSNNRVKLGSQDIERVHYAKELLVERMEDPPSLLELAKAVGLNDFKLKKAFREVTGNTVYGYLREQRMKRAHSLLEQGAMNVTEVTFEVGYQNPSHFAAVFKKQFGVLPSSFSA